MSYSSLLLEEGIDSQYMAIITPKRKVTSWVLHSGSVYKSDFDYGYVSRVFTDGSEMVGGSSPSLSANEFYYDFADEILYVRTSGGGDPSSNFVVAHFEIYTATFDKHWYRDPLDNTETQVYWEPIIAKSPSLKATTTDVLFGYLPVQTSSITLNNFEHTFERMIYDSSFNKASIKIYHLLDELDFANIKLVYDGFMSDLSYDQETVTIKCFDRRDIFNEEYRNPSGDESFFNDTDFPSIDPNFKGRPIRKVYGLVDGVVPINIDYKQTEPTTSDNRNWVVQSGQSNIADLSRTCGGGTHTSTRTYINDATGFTIGDSVWFDKGTDEYKTLTDVNYVSNYVEHSALSVTCVDGDLLKRSFVGNITIVQNQEKYYPMFGRDYTSNYSMAADSIGFDFVTGLEANLSLPNTLSTSDPIFCRVYGQTNNVTLGGPALGSDDDQTGNLTNPISILIKLMKELGIQESEINQSSFTSIVSTANKPIGLSIPKNVNDNFPTYKEVFIEIFGSLLLRMFIDNDAKWKASLVSEITGAADKTIEDDEIIRGSFDYNFSYNEILSEIIVQYFYREKDSDTNKQNTYSKVTATSDNAKYLHGIKKQKTFTSLHLREVDAQDLADRLSDIFGERSGELTLKSKNRFFDTLLNDRIQTDRTKLPGFAYDGETINSRKFAVVTTEKSLRDVKILLDDQKGIQDNNSGNW
jgi:hypothetical protein